MRTVLQPITPSVVRLTEDAVDHDGDVRRQTTEYFTSAAREPGHGYYVRIRDAAGRCPQVCNGLARRGPTLMVQGDDPLINSIRREARRRTARLRREVQHG